MGYRKLTDDEKTAFLSDDTPTPDIEPSGEDSTYRVLTDDEKTSFLSDDTPTPDEPEDKNFFERVGESWEKRGEETSRMASSLMGSESEWPTALGYPATLAATGGQVVAAGWDVTTEAGISAFKTVVGDDLKEDWDIVLKRDIAPQMQKFLRSDAGQYALEKAKEGGAIWTEFAKDNPNAAIFIDSAMNLAALGPVKKLFGTAWKEVGDIIGDAGTAYRRSMPVKATKRLLSEMNGNVRDTFHNLKLIKPADGKTSTALSIFYKKSGGAVRTIVKYKDFLEYTDEFGDIVKGQLPETMEQFAQAITSIKRQIFKEYDSILKEAGRNGAVVKWDNVLRELKNVKKNAGESYKYRELATKKIAEIEKEMVDLGPTLSAENAQDRIQKINNNIRGSQITYDAADSARIDAMVGNILRNDLFKSIEKSTVKNLGARAQQKYANLRKAYGWLKEIEPHINRKNISVLNKTGQSPIEYYNIYTSAKLLQGVIAGNVATVAYAGASKTMSKAREMVQSPSANIKNMFKSVEGAMDKIKRVESKKFERKSDATTIKFVTDKVNKRKSVTDQDYNPYTEGALDPKLGDAAFQRKGKTLSDTEVITPEPQAVPYQPKTDFTKSTTPPPLETKLWPAEPSWKGKNKAELKAYIEEGRKMKALDAAFQEQERLKGLKGPSVVSGDVQSTSKIPAPLKTTMHPAEVPTKVYRTTEETGLGADFYSGIHFNKRSSVARSYAAQYGKGGGITEWELSPSAKIWQNNTLDNSFHKEFPGGRKTSVEAAKKAGWDGLENIDGEIVVWNHDKIKAEAPLEKKTMAELRKEAEKLEIEITTLRRMREQIAATKAANVQPPPSVISGVGTGYTKPVAPPNIKQMLSSDPLGLR